MPTTISRRVTDLPSYAFAEVDKKVRELREAGVTPVDFGVGDPSCPTPAFIREAMAKGADEYASAGYPSYVGGKPFLEAVAAWTERRFGVKIDAGSEICSTIGSKEGIFNFAETLVDPGDVVLCPSPGYPPYNRGTLFAEGKPWLYGLPASNDFLPDLESIPAEVVAKAKILWINYPNSPSGRVATRAELQTLYDWARKNDVVLASDEAYSELYFTDEPPTSILEIGRENTVVFQSLSKRSAMTGYRIGWVAGDQRIVSAFKKVKTNIDSGTPNFVQAGAIAALADEDHVAEMRAEYREKRDILCAAFRAAGLPDSTPEGTIYVWQRVPEGMTSLDFAQTLLREDIAAVCTPGPWIAEKLADGTSPGDGFVRFALVPTIEETKKTADAIAKLSL